MKKLSIEEKAKHYDEALKVAKSNYETIVQMDNDCTFSKVGLVNTFHHMFPELKESDDEKIRKALIELVHDTTGDSLWVDYNVHKEDVIAWLEKQGKNMGISEATKQKLEDNLNKALEKETPESWNKFLDEQKPAWSEEDDTFFKAIIRDIENIQYISENAKKDRISWLKSLKDRYTWKPSDEQMKALTFACIKNANIDKSSIKALYDLKEQLKKLREE